MPAGMEYQAIPQARTLHELAAEISRVNAANNWDAATLDNLPGKLMMCVTELDESADAAHVGEGTLGIELADVAIYLLSFLHGAFGQHWHDRITGRHPYKRSAFAPIEVLLWPTLRSMCRAAKAWRKGQDDNTCIALELALLEIWRLADALGFDMLGNITAKVEVNRLRGPLHGHRRSLG